MTVTGRASADRNFTQGVTAIPGGVHICVTVPGRAVSLLLYRKGGREPEEIPFPEESRIGDCRTMDLLCGDLAAYTYTFLVDGKEITDPSGRDFADTQPWGVYRGEMPRRCRFPSGDDGWENDRHPGHSFRDTVIYRLHVRGFTKSATSGAGKAAGTFRAAAARIPYIRELGATAVELMPVYDFQEVMTRREERPRHAEEPASADGSTSAGGSAQPGGAASADALRDVPTGKINYWGYTPDSRYFAPKAAYSAGDDPCREFRDMVREFHRNDIEVYVELYFPAGTPAQRIQEAARFWVWEYHVDGIRLNGTASPAILLDDPMLAETKIFAASWFGMLPAAEPFARKEKKKVRLAEYNDGFLEDMRCVLRGDSGRLGSLVFRTKNNPAGCAEINYLANTNGFTMMDMVSYNERHNEANGEDNRDGMPDDRSWNCGAEGRTRSVKIRELRFRQLRNAFLLLLLSQGTPLILAGDEFGNSQRGNNNAYCQDNSVSWLDWRDLEKNQGLYSFVRKMIAFRKAHPVFHLPEEPKNVDYLSKGFPDVSYHGENAWQPDFGDSRRALGILYNGAYGIREDGSRDDTFYVAYNMHWDTRAFWLPRAEQGFCWRIAVTTELPDDEGIFGEGRERTLADPACLRVPGRCIVVLRAVPAGEDSSCLPASGGAAGEDEAARGDGEPELVGADAAAELREDGAGDHVG
jgi:isoamylase